MGLTIVAGRAGSGKSRRIYRQMGRLERAGKEAVLLVPEQYTLEAERALLSAVDAPGLLYAQVMSPSRLMEDVFARVGGPREAVLNERGKAMALRRVAENCMAQLTIFNRVVRRPGFAAGMAGLLSDLKSFDITAGRLEAASRGDDLLNRKLRDVSVLYRAFDQFLDERDFMDGEDRMAAFIERLPQARYLENTAFFVDEFDYLPPRTIRMLGALLRLGGRLTVTLTLGEASDRDAMVFEAGRRSLDALHDMARAVGQPVTIERMTRIPGSVTGRAAAIDYLERELYAYPAAAWTGENHSVRLMEASTPEDEVESAAGRVAGLVRREGLRWRDMAVVCGDLHEYGPRVQRIFARHGIPVFMDNRRPVLHHPAVFCLLSSLRVLARDYRMTDMLSLLKSGYVGIPEGSAEELERYVTQFGIQGRRRWENPWKQGTAEYNLAALNQWRAAVAAPLAALHEKAARKAAASTWAEGLFELLESLGTAGRLREEAEGLRQRELTDQAAESTQVWNAMMDMLDQVNGLLSDMELTALEMADLMETGFAAAEVGVLPTGSDLVLVGDVGRTKTASVRHLFVLGTVEGMLPVRYPEGMVFHDRDLARLTDVGVEVGRSASVRSAQSRQGVYAAFCKPLHGLWLYWPLTDGAGGARQPSPLVSRIGRLLGTGPKKAPPPDITTPAAAMGPLSDALRSLWTGAEDSADWKLLIATLYSLPSWRPRIAAMTSLPRPGAGLGESAGASLPAVASISQLEQYARCSFSWFVAYALAPAEWKRYGVALSDAGSFVHSATAQFGEQLLKFPDPSDLTEEEAVGLMDDVVAALTRELTGSVLTDDGHGRWMAGRLGGACRLAARSFLRQMQQGAFRPLSYEMGFGPRGPFPLIRSRSGTGMALQGVIDRVDVYPADECDYLRVIDYKTGASKLDLAGAMDGFQVQLWVYMNALCAGWQQVMGRPARPAGVFYFPVRDDYLTDKGGDMDAARLEAARMDGLCLQDQDVLRAMDRALDGPGSRSSIVGVRMNAKGAPLGAVCPPGDMEAIGRGVMSTVDAVLHNIREGCVEARPLRTGRNLVCSWCPYKSVCTTIEPIRSRRPPSREAVTAWIENNREVNPDA